MSRPFAISLGLGLLSACAHQSQPAEPQSHGHGHGHGHGHAKPGDGHDVHHRFDDAEQWAKHFDDPSRDEWQRPDAVVAALELQPDHRVVDLGAGTGYFAVRLARAVPEGEVLANDVEPDMVRYVGERAQKEGLGNLRGVQGEPGDPHIEGAVDLAFMCNVVHHIEDRAAFFARVAEHLTEGGRLAIVDFKKDAPEDAPGPPPAMRVAQDELVRELESFGFALLRADRELMPYQYLVVVERSG